MNHITSKLVTDLQADETEIRAFVDFLFRYADAGTLVGLRSFTHDKDDQAARIHGWPAIQGNNSTLISAAIAAATQAANNPKGLVFAPPIATFWPTQEPGVLQRARLVDLANGLGISVELDEGDTLALRQKLEHLLGPATVVVASGGLWIDQQTGEIHPRLHLHWRLSEPTRTAAEHAMLKEARDLAALLVGADRSAIPLVHPLRWPGSWHCKGAPRLAKIVTNSPDAEVHLEDALATLQEAVEASGLKIGGKSEGPHTPGEPQASPARVAAAVMAIPNLDTTSWDDWNRLGLLIHRASGGGSEELELWIDWSQRSAKYVAGECQSRWEHFHGHPFTKSGAGTLFYMAKAHGLVMEKPSSHFANVMDAHQTPHAEPAGDDADVGGAETEPSADDAGAADDAENVADLEVERTCRLSDVEFAAQKKELAERCGMTSGDLASIRRKFLAKSRKDADQKAKAAKESAENAEKKAKRDNSKKAYEEADVKIRKLVERFNSEYLVVNEGGKALIFQRMENEILKRREFKRLSSNDLKMFYMNERIQVGVDMNGDPKMRNVASVWLGHENRQQFIKGVAFDPSGQTPDGVLNLWEGFGFEPVAGDWSLLREHIETVLCGGDRAQSEYLLNWLARLVQYPGQQGEVAVVLKGVEGCGKGTLATAVKTMIGHHALAIANANHLVGNFNEHLRDVIFLFADEAFFAGDKQHVGVLKSLITENTLTIEGKYANAVEFPNFLHIMMASNEEWVVPADLRSRRWFVLDVPDTKVGDYPYFEKVRKQLDAGGYAAMLYDLLNRDISAFNVRAIPQTEGLEQQRHLSLDSHHAWWLDCLERGYVFRSKLGLEEVFGVWPEEFVSTEILFASYLEFAKSRNERRPYNRVQLGKLMGDMKGIAGRKRGGIVGEHLVEDEDAGGRLIRRPRPLAAAKPSGYSFGGLASAREAFEMVTRMTIIWDDGDPVMMNEQPEPSAAKATKPANPHLTP